MFEKYEYFGLNLNFFWSEMLYLPHYFEYGLDVRDIVDIYL